MCARLLLYPQSNPITPLASAATSFLVGKGNFCFFFENEEEGNVIKKGMRLFGSFLSADSVFHTHTHTVHTTSLPSP